MSAPRGGDGDGGEVLGVADVDEGFEGGDQVRVTFSESQLANVFPISRHSLAKTVGGLHTVIGYEIKSSEGGDTGEAEPEGD